MGCITNPINPSINDDKFEDYVPWWTNKIESITNTIDIVTNIIGYKEGCYVYNR